jgi:SNF2-related domain/Helicase conserved C-terminal domain
LRTLIVAPLPVLEDAWLKHIKSFDPQAHVIVVDPRNRQPFIDALKGKKVRNPTCSVHGARSARANFAQGEGCATDASPRKTDALVSVQNAESGEHSQERESNSVASALQAPVESNVQTVKNNMLSRRDFAQTATSSASVRKTESSPNDKTQLHTLGESEQVQDGGTTSKESMDSPKNSTTSFLKHKGEDVSSADGRTEITQEDDSVSTTTMSQALSGVSSVLGVTASSGTSKQEGKTGTNKSECTCGAPSHFIIHYEGARLLAAELQKITWFHIILDEAQRIKNKDAKVTKAIKGIRAKRKTALSGTPADDKPYDLWSIINFLWPSYYKSYWRFRNYYCLFTSEVNYQTGQTYQKFSGVQNGKALQREMSPWFVRRLKEDVLDDLPDKYYSPIRVELHPKQRKAYEEMKRDMLTWVGENENTPLVASVAVAKLIRLQQFALGYMEAYEVEVRKRNPKNDDWVRNKDGSVRLFKETKWRISEPSSKLDALMEVIDETDRQIVVFSQFKSVLTLLSRRLDKANISHGLYTGDVSVSDRNRLVQNFQAGNTRVFAGTIAAGGTGLTLTAASTGVFLDRSWKPTMNFQAEDRMHRIGQPNAVQIIDIIARNTVDMGRLQTISWKWSMLRAILGDNNR